MAAYVIVSYDITDPEGYQAYVPGVIPLLAKHGGEVLVAAQDATVLEGAPRTTEVVLRFADEATALAWYNDPAYVEVRKIRLAASANTRMVVAKAFAPPGQ